MKINLAKRFCIGCWVLTTVLLAESRRRSDGRNGSGAKNRNHVRLLSRKWVAFSAPASTRIEGLHQEPDAAHLEDTDFFVAKIPSFRSYKKLTRLSNLKNTSFHSTSVTRHLFTFRPAELEDKWNPFWSWLLIRVNFGFCGDECGDETTMTPSQMFRLQWKHSHVIWGTNMENVCKQAGVKKF